MSYIGTTEIGKMFLGDVEIDKAYLGETLVFKSGEDAPPYDSLIEYLESSGSQYIDTGYTPNANTVFIMEANLTSTQNGITMAGLYREKTYVQRFHIGTYQSQWHFGISSNIASSKYVNFTGGINTNRHTFEARGTGYCAVDSATKQITVNNSRDHTMSIYLFARNAYVKSRAVDQYTKMRLYGVQISEGGSLIHDYVPCRIGQVGYLYDTVGKSLLGNNGSGSFSLGSDIIE